MPELYIDKDIIIVAAFTGNSIYPRHGGDIIRNIPTVTIPDDHDVGQSNLWGAGGKISNTQAGHGPSRKSLHAIKAIDPGDNKTLTIVF